MGIRGIKKGGARAHLKGKKEDRADPSGERVVNAVILTLRHMDQNTTSVNDIIRIVGHKLGVDVSSHKTLIRRCCKAYVADNMPFRADLCGELIRRCTKEYVKNTADKEAAEKEAEGADDGALPSKESAVTVSDDEPAVLATADSSS